MTLKENIIKLQTYKMFEGEDTLYVERDDVLKLLEQETSGDLISRQAVIDAIEDDNRNGHYSCFASNNDAQCFKDVIRSLPSVNPQEPIYYPPCEDCHNKMNEIRKAYDKIQSAEPETGHWEWLTEDKYRCSNCNSETRVDECMNEPMYDFCPFCGARMESE